MGERLPDPTLGEDGEKGLEYSDVKGKDTNDSSRPSLKGISPVYCQLLKQLNTSRWMRCYHRDKLAEKAPHHKHSTEKKFLKSVCVSVLAHVCARVCVHVCVLHR